MRAVADEEIDVYRQNATDSVPHSVWYDWMQFRDRVDRILKGVINMMPGTKE